MGGPVADEIILCSLKVLYIVCYILRRSRPFFFFGLRIEERIEGDFRYGDFPPKLGDVLHRTYGGTHVDSISKR